MLQLILGAAGRGKTHEIFERISKLPEDAHSILLVPEQASFEYERQMLSLPAGKRAQVLSFTRLCHAVGKEVGGIAGTPLSSEEKLLLMAKAVTAAAGDLKLYRKQVGQVPFYRRLLSLITECHHKGVTPGTLLAGSSLIQGMGLAEKLREIALIFSLYEQLVAEQYLDPEEQLTRLHDTLESHPYFAGKEVFVDSFKDFTVPQLKLMGQILAQSRNVTVALCADGLSPRHNLELFANTKGVANTLIRMAGSAGVTVASPIILTHNHRGNNPALQHLAQVLEGDDTPFSGDAHQITLCRCQSVYDEITAVAEGIQTLVREQGLRYSDITVVMADPTPYEGLLDGVFGRYAIPYFFDSPHPFAHQPLAAFVMKAMELASLGLDSNKILSLAKTGLAGLTTDDVAMLENYCFTWSIKGREWLTEFTRHPDGPKELTPAMKETLNGCRTRLMQPLIRFVEDCKGTHTGKEYAAALYRLLTQYPVFEQLQRISHRLTEKGDGFEGEEVIRSWQVLMDLLDKTVRAAGNTPYTPKEFTHLMGVMIAGVEMGQIPQSLNQVTVGVADRVRPARCKAVFLMGTNTGVFPQSPATGGLLSDYDRALMNQADIPLSNRCEFDTVEGEFLFYHLCCQASDFVTFTYLTANREQELSPSFPVTRIKKAFPGCCERNAREYYTKTAPLAKAVTPDTALEQLAATWEDRSPENGSLYRFLAQHHPEKLRLLEITEQPIDTRISPHHARALFGKDITLSPSGVEVYHKCRFYYFCQYGLRITPKKKIEIDTLSRGSMVHYVLEHMLKRYGSKGLSTLEGEQMKKDIHAMLLQFVEEELGGMEGKSPTFCFTLTRVEDLLFTLLCHMAAEMADSLFQTAGCEVSMGKDKDMAPYTLSLPGGGTLSVIGTIDRVDTYQKDGVTYIRVVDYKTGKKDFCLEDIYYGMGLQMLIYLYAAQENGVRFGDNRQPAGILYMPAEQGEAASEEAWADKVMKDLRMKGLINDLPEVLHAMDPAATGAYLPITYKKGEVGGSLASLEFFGKTRRMIDRLLTEMGAALQQGEILCNPRDPSGGYNACSFCAYQAICPLDGDAPHHTVASLSAAEKKALLKGEDPHGI